jgi:hypothetical integral membrane protein (TIGR02206 family)
MEYYFAKDFAGPGFKLFGMAHLTALGIIFLVILFLIFLRKLKNESLNKGFRYTIAVLLILQEISYHLWNIYIGEWTLQKMLPFHICSVFVWLCAYMLITGNRQIYIFAYFLGISGAVQALMTPDIADYGFPHYRFFHIFSSHGAIIISTLYMTIVERYRPTFRSIGKVFIWLNIYSVIVFFINWLIGSNYLYVTRKPDTASLFDLLGPWPVYILAAEGVALIMFLILYLPFAISNIFRKRFQDIPGNI